MPDKSALETIDNSFQIGRNYPMIQQRRMSKCGREPTHVLLGGFNALSV
ncbi:hypothetical protein [uncultured Nostoc sp.]